MSEENTTNSEQQESQYEELSKTDAMAGVFTSAGETYETIANTPKKNYWLVPIVIFIVVNLITTFLFMRDAELINKTMEKQRQKMQQQMEEKVKSGQMTQEQSAQAQEQAEKFMNPKSPFFMAIGYGGSIVGPFIVLLILGLLYFIALKVLKANSDFSNILNVVGLALLITAVGNLISTVISIIRGEPSSVGLGLLFSEEAVGAKLSAFLTKLDVFSIWYYVVVAIGLSKIGRVGVGKCAVFVFGIWIIYIVATSLIF